eukprot:143412_1
MNNMNYNQNQPPPNYNQQQQQQPQYGSNMNFNQQQQPMPQYGGVQFNDPQQMQGMNPNPQQMQFNDPQQYGSPQQMQGQYGSQQQMQQMQQYGSQQQMMPNPQQYGSQQMIQQNPQQQQQFGGGMQPQQQQQIAQMGDNWSIQSKAKFWDQQSQNEFIMNLRPRIIQMLGGRKFDANVNQLTTSINQTCDKCLKAFKKPNYKYVSHCLLVPKGSPYNMGDSKYWKAKTDVCITLNVDGPSITAVVEAYCIGM